MLYDLGLGQVNVSPPVHPDVMPEGRKYGPSAGYPALRILLAQKEKVEVENISITTGASLGLIASLSLLPKNTDVLCPSPYYPAYPGMIRTLGLNPVFYSLIPEQEWALNLKEIERLISSKTSAILLNFPANPTGSIPTKSCLLKLKQLIKKHQLFTILDEVYADLIFDKNTTPLSRIFNDIEQVVSVRSFSKYMGLAGERLGYVIAAKNLIQKINAAHWIIAMSAPYTAQKLAIRFLSDRPETRLNNLRNQLSLLRDLAYNRLVENKLFEINYPQAGLFLWLKTDRNLYPAEALVKDLKEQKGIIVIPGRSFGEKYSDYLRLSYAVPEILLKEAVSGIQQLVNKKHYAKSH